MLIALIVSLLFPACASEDSNNCYWNAATSGNGKGSSFLVIEDTVIYF